MEVTKNPWKGHFQQQEYLLGQYCIILYIYNTYIYIPRVHTISENRQIHLSLQIPHQSIHYLWFHMTVDFWPIRRSSDDSGQIITTLHRRLGNYCAFWEGFLASANSGFGRCKWYFSIIESTDAPRKIRKVGWARLQATRMGPWLVISRVIASRNPYEWPSFSGLLGLQPYPPPQKKLDRGPPCRCSNG